MQNVKSHFDGAQGCVEMSAHEIGKREAAFRHPQEKRAAFIDHGDVFPGIIPVGEKSSRIDIAFEGMRVEQAEQLSFVDRMTSQGSEFTEQGNPGVQVRRAVIGVGHCRGETRRRCNHIDLAV